MELKTFVHTNMNGGSFQCFSSDMTEYGYLLVGEHSFNFELPVGFDPVVAQIKSLEQGLDKIQREHDTKVANIKEQIQKLMCIENKPST